jgi:REP-associated tyrosine transposase
MPRAARLDILNILQHVIVRGIEKSDIFRDYADRRDFTRRLEFLLEDTGVECLAWAPSLESFPLTFAPAP